MNALIASYSLLAIERDKSSPVDLKENHSLETLDGVVNVNCEGTAVLVGHLQEPIETVKAEGSNRSLKSKWEKFAKGLIGVSGDDDGYKKASGQKREIVPESNVMKTRAGEEITFKILLDAVVQTFGCVGKPHGASALDGPHREAHRNQRQGLRPSIAQSNPRIFRSAI